jgi:cellulose synthase/poly-beta-1,6-N-acetylglucosamine synthase-like glycosyltransferase
MALTTLALLMTGMWAMILAAAVFLVIFVAPLETYIYLFGPRGGRLTISAVQAVIAILIVVALALALNRLKGIYLHRKLQE